MKSSLLFLLLSSILFLSCEKDFPGLIDSTIEQYQVISVSPSGNVVYNAIDSLIILRINFTQSSEVGLVVCDLYSPDNKKLNSLSVLLYDNGDPEFGDDVAKDNKFANKFPMSTFDPVGIYSVRFYTQGKFGSYNLIAQTSFEYDNGQNNIAPVISNLQMSTMVSVGQTITFSVDVADDNGLNDIEFVFYEAYNPDGVKIVNSQGISQFPMFDDGITQATGDLTANDGTFTVRLTFPTTVQTGLWRFDFRARDRGGLFSNIISHNLSVE